MRRSIFLAVALMFFAISGSYAQERGHDTRKEMSPEKRVENRMAMLTERLDLSEEQAGRIMPIVENMISAELAAKAQVRAQHEDAHSKISEILDDAQRAKFESIHQEREESHSGGKGNKKGCCSKGGKGKKSGCSKSGDAEKSCCSKKE